MPGTSTSTDAEHKANRLPLLDGWRGMAIIFLLIGHYVHFSFFDFGTNGPFNFGRLGVELFFVLSGTLMGRILFLRQDPLPIFYKRRLSRILPAAFVFLTIITLAAALKGKELSYVGILSAYTFWINYFYVANVTIIGIPIEHFWSLSVEEHSYIILSLVALSHRRWKFSPILLLVIMIAICFTCAYWEGMLSHWDYYHYYWRTECRASSIFLGTLFGLLASRHRPEKDGQEIAPTFYGLVTGAFILGLALQATIVPDIVKYTLGTACLAYSINHVDYLVKPIRAILKSPVFVHMGTWSFSIYLYQQPLARFGIKGIPLALGAGLLSFYLVERPMRERLNQWFGAKRAIESPVPSEPVVPVVATGSGKN